MSRELSDDPQTKTSQPSVARDRLSLLSHDLRAALSDVLGGVRLIDRGVLDPETLAHFERISAAGETLARLLDKTLIDDPNLGPGMVTQAVNLNLTEFLSDIRRRWSDHATEKGILFAVEAAASLPAIVTVDRVALDRVIANLIGNAIKFTDKGRVVLSVFCDPDRALCFHLRDQGPGLSEGSLARLFQFEGRPTDTQKPGTGLGLFIAKELSALLGAELQVQNRPEGGAEAILCLPHAAWFDRALRKSAKEAGPPETGSVSLAGLNILLAEDNLTNQLVATQMLSAMDAKYQVASDGLEALELLETQEFDLALLDIEMPRMSGLELIKAIRSMPDKRARMPLVALTAYVMREHRERIYGAGADGIIAKPLMSIEELGVAVLEYFNGAKRRDLPGSGDGNDAGLPDGDVVDRKIFDTLVTTIGADSTAELLSKLQADTDTVAEGLGRGRKNLDLVEIRSQTHILISVAGAIGAKRLQQAAQRLNAAANRNEAKEVDSLCKTCLTELADLQAFILDEQAKVDPRP